MCVKLSVWLNRLWLLMHAVGHFITVKQFFNLWSVNTFRVTSWKNRATLEINRPCSLQHNITSYWLLMMSSLDSNENTSYLIHKCMELAKVKILLGVWVQIFIALLEIWMLYWYAVFSWTCIMPAFSYSPWVYASCNI